jgi:hypothetical protein
LILVARPRIHIRHCRGTLSALETATIRQSTSINNILRHLGRNIRLREITPELDFEFQQKRLEEGVGKATVNRDLATDASKEVVASDSHPMCRYSSRAMLSRCGAEKRKLEARYYRNENTAENLEN